MSNHLRSLALLLAILLVPLFVCAGQQRGRGLTLGSGDQLSTLPAAAKRWALLIGVDEYQDSQISKLRGAARDAETLGDALVKYAGFPSAQVVVLSSGAPAERQPTRVNILRRLSNLAAVVPPDGLLLVSFSGHGIERGGQAFLLPSDAQVSDDISLLEETAVSVSRMRERIRDTHVGQVMILLDACRNDPTSGRADTVNPLSKIFAKSLDFNVANREVQAFATIYATAIGQRAYEYAEKRQGYFTWALVEGLKGAAADEAGKVTLGRLVRYVQETVSRQVAVDLGAGKDQRPFATIEGYRAEDLVVAVGATGALDGGGGARDGGGSVELTYWETIKNSTDAEDFEAYLRKYPNGDFADLARNRLRTLKRPAAPVVVDVLALAAGGSFAGSGLRLTSGTTRIEPVAGSNIVTVAGGSRVLFFYGPGFSSPYGYHAAEVAVDGVATSVTVTRIGVKNGASTPAWQVQAFDASGNQVGATIGEGDIGTGNFLFPAAPQDFTISASGIKRLRFASNNNNSTFSAIPFARVAVTLAP